MNYLVKRAVTAGLLGLLANACSSSSSSDAPPVSLDQYPQQYAKVFCETIAPCCMSAAIPFDPLTCKSTATQNFTLQVQLSNGLNTKYDATAAGNCLSALKGALQKCQSIDAIAFGATCSDVFVGTQPVGAACTSDADCAGHGLCGVSGGGATGVCAARTASGTATKEPHGKAGDPCVGDCATFAGAIECQGSATSGTVTAYCYAGDGLHCSFTSQTCTVLPPVGAPCPDAQCVDGAFCDLSTITCLPQRDSGSCLGSRAVCSAKSYCDQATSQCFAKKPDGYSCLNYDECVSGSCSSTGNAGTCGAGTAVTTDACAGQIN